MGRLRGLHVLTASTPATCTAFMLSISDRQRISTNATWSLLSSSSMTKIPKHFGYPSEIQLFLHPHLGQGEAQNHQFRRFIVWTKNVCWVSFDLLCVCFNYRRFKVPFTGKSRGRSWLYWANKKTFPFIQTWEKTRKLLRRFKASFAKSNVSCDTD